MRARMKSRVLQSCQSEGCTQQIPSSNQCLQICRLEISSENLESKKDARVHALPLNSAAGCSWSGRAAPSWSRLDTVLHIHLFKIHLSNSVTRLEKSQINFPAFGACIFFTHMYDLTSIAVCSSLSLCLCLSLSSSAIIPQFRIFL